MPQYKGTPGPRSRSEWVGEQGWGAGIGNFQIAFEMKIKKISNKIKQEMYWLVHIVVLPIGLQTPSAPWVLSLAPPLGALCSIQ